MEKFANDFKEKVVKEEISQKKQQIKLHGKEVIDIFEDIKWKSSTLRYMCILRVMNKLNKGLYQRVMTVHTRKISRIECYKELPMLMNISKHFFLQINIFLKACAMQRLKLCYS